jgi:hypothetical protein
VITGVSVDLSNFAVGLQSQYSIDVQTNFNINLLTMRIKKLKIKNQTGVIMMSKKNSKIHCENCNLDGQIKITKTDRFHHALTIVGYFFFAAALGGIILSWVFLAKILSISVSNGADLLVNAFLLTFYITGAVGIAGVLMAIKKKRLKCESCDSVLAQIP